MDNYHGPAELSRAVVALKTLTDRIGVTRNAILQFADSIQRLISDMPKDEVAAAGLRVRVVMRGLPRVDERNVTVEYLPPTDIPDFDSRPGATAMYLEALGNGDDRVYVEIRLSPGTVVTASSTTDIITRTLEDVRGIGIFDDGPRLVTWRPDRGTQPGLKPFGFLEFFLRCLADELERRGRFNLAITPNG